MSEKSHKHIAHKIYRQIGNNLYLIALSWIFTCKWLCVRFVPWLGTGSRLDKWLYRFHFLLLNIMAYKSCSSIFFSWLQGMKRKFALYLYINSCPCRWLNLYFISALQTLLFVYLHSKPLLTFESLHNSLSKHCF